MTRATFFFRAAQLNILMLCGALLVVLAEAGLHVSLDDNLDR
jgi:hypothetical protein